MQVTVQHSNVCEVNHEPHPEPLLEVFENVMDIATDKDYGCVMLRLEGDRLLELNRACVLKMEVVI